MEAQLLITDVSAIRITDVHERGREGMGGEKFVRIITIRYADDSEYQICLTANRSDKLEITEEPPP